MAPSLEVTTTPARIIQLVHPDGSKTCLFFQGNEVYKPEGCVLAIHGEAPQVDELFETLPLP